MIRFTMYLQRVFVVHGCATKRAEEQRGLMGFHDIKRCPACVIVPDGFELWGENGHKQGAIPEGADVVSYLANRLNRDKRLQVAGAPPIHYVGTWAE